MTLSGLDVIARSDDFEARAAAYELRGWQWAFLHHIDGTAELRDIAMTGGVDLDLAIDFVAESEAAGLVRVVAMTLHDYRAQHGIAEPYAAHEASVSDTLGGYENAPPAWMMEEPVAAHAASTHAWEAPEPYGAEPGPDHRDEAVAEQHEWAPDPHVAEYHEEPIAEHAAPEAAAPSYEWTPDAHVAEHHDGPVVEHDDEVAEHHAYAVSETAVPSYEWTPDAYVAEHHDETMADASSTVAGLMSLEAHADATAIRAEHSEPDPQFSANGHASNEHAAYSWEPMSLVTTVNPEDGEHPHERPVHDEHATASSPPDMPDGISIWLSPNSETHAEHGEHVESVHEYETHEQGSISFSFSPESDAADHAAVEMPVAAAPAAHAASSEVDDAVADASDGSAMPQQLRMDTTNAATGKGDLVGNLLARAFTFRMK